MINFILALVMGGIMGWLASKVMNTDAQQGIFLNVIVGVVGSFLGNIIAGFAGMGASLTTFEPLALLWAFIGAVVLLAIVNLVRRGQVR